MMIGCAQLCFAASCSDEGYEAIADAIRRLNIRAKKFPVHKGNDNDDQFEGLHPNVVKDPIICRTKETQPKATKTKKSGQSIGGHQCGHCTRVSHNIRTCPLLSGAQNNNRNAQSQSGTSMEDENVDASAFSHEDFDLEMSPGSESEQESDDLIHHMEEARTFDFFFSGYEGHFTPRSGSIQNGSPYSTTRGTYSGGQSLRSTLLGPWSTPFHSPH